MLLNPNIIKTVTAPDNYVKIGFHAVTYLLFSSDYVVTEQQYTYV